MYLIELDGITYEPKGGGAFTLPGALAELRGTRGARILRTDGTVAVDQAGSDYAVTHAPTGRRIVRRMTNRARHQWVAELAARSPHRVTTAPPADRVPVVYTGSCRYCQRYERACGRHETAAA